MQSYIFYRNFAEKNYLCAMQLNAISRKSAIMAMALLLVMLFAAVVRYWFAPFQMELADSEVRGSFLFVVIALIAYFCSAFIQGKMLLRSELVGSYTTLSMPISALLACGIFVAPNMIEASVASLCFTVALYLLMRSLHAIEEKDSVFFASILLGIMPLLYSPSVVLIAVIPIAIFLLALSLRQSLLMIIGYIVPFFVASYIGWYSGNGFFDMGAQLFSSFITPQMTAIEQVPYVAIVMASLILLLLIWGVIYAAVRPTKTFALTRVRRALYFFLLVLLASLTIIFVPGCNLSVCAIIAAPATILLGFVLDVLPNNASTISYWVLLALFVVHLFVA